MIRWLTVFVLVAAPCAAQQGAGNDCTPAGVWYGGSVVAYQMTITPAGPAGHYIVSAQGMYKNSVMNTVFTGRLVKNGNVYEGSIMQLATMDPDFLNPPPTGKMPDLNVAWSSVQMVDCGTLRNTIPFFGVYFAAGIWTPGPVWLNGKVPLVDAPDLDLLDVLSGGTPIVEEYRRLPTAIDPALLH